jgi:hypothetical protein
MPVRRFERQALSLRLSQVKSLLELWLLALDEAFDSMSTASAATLYLCGTVSRVQDKGASSLRVAIP